jgi:hypothetical protein
MKIKIEKIEWLGLFITKYFSQIIFVPLLLGGLIQVIKLVWISPQTIRFFSPTQAISDGLVILSIGFLFIIGYIILNVFLFFYGNLLYNNPNRQTIKEWEEENGERYAHLSERTSKLGHLIIFCACIFSYYMIFQNLPKTLEIRDLNVIEIISYAPIVLLLNFAISISVSRFIFWNEKYFSQDNRKEIDMFFILINIVTIFIYINLTSNAKNIVSNFKKVETKYCCEYSGTAKIVYFNDKYIFIERKCNKEEKELIIEKFEAVFEK